MPPPLTALQFRKALGQFATGVTVVTVERAPGEVHGMTANSFTSVSLEPMLVLVCVDRRARLLSLLGEKKRFGVSVLNESQQATSEYFAKGDLSVAAEKRLGIGYRLTDAGIPVLEDALLRIGCHLVSSHAAGDHTIFVGEVETAEIQQGEPLLFFRGKYHKIARPR
jgi:flavin reductase (DIM6/NTAB) family NADH-FMN oxidoreductase RutF